MGCGTDTVQLLKLRFPLPAADTAQGFVWRGFAQGGVALRARTHPDAVLCFNNLQFLTGRQEVIPNIIDANSLWSHTARPVEQAIT